MRTLKTILTTNKQQGNNFNFARIKLATLLIVTLAAMLIFSACAEQKTGEAILKIVSPEVIPGATYNLNEEADEITVTFTAQWVDENSTNDNKVYVNLVDVTGDTASGGTIIQNEYEVLSEKVGNRFVATEQEFTFRVPTDRVGQRNYFVTVEHTHNLPEGKTQTTRTNNGLFVITVVDPNSNGDDNDNTEEGDTFELGITRQPRGGNFKVGDNINLFLETNAPQDMQLSYQWYSRTFGNGDFTPVSGATGASYSPPSNYEYSGHAYRCVVTEVGTDNSVTSGIVNVSVTEPFVYTFAITSQPTGGSYTASGSVPLAVSASTNSGNPLRYQWYTNLANSTEGAVALQGANSNVFYVNTTNDSNQYYFCYVTDSYRNTPRTIATNIVNVVVTGATQDTPTPTPTPTTDDVWVKGVQVTSVNATDVLLDGTVSYDFATKTLRLNNAMLEYSSSSYDSTNTYKNAVIGSNTDLIIELTGANIIGYYEPAGGGIPAETAAIRTSGSLTFTGDGDLNATAPYAAHGFIVGGNLIVGSAQQVSVTGGSSPVGLGRAGYNGASVTGTITVGGTFIATGSKGGSVPSVASGAGTTGTIGGSGAVAAAITVNAGGRFEATGGDGGFGGASTLGLGGTGGEGGTGVVSAATIMVDARGGTLEATGGEGGLGGSGTTGGTGGAGGAGAIVGGVTINIPGNAGSAGSASASSAGGLGGAGGTIT